MKYTLNLTEEQSNNLITLLTEMGNTQPDYEDLIDEVIGSLKSPQTTTPTGDLSRRVEHLLLNTTLSYQDIVSMVRDEFPTCNTSTKSVASVACVMRKKGRPVPLRLKLNIVD